MAYYTPDLYFEKQGEQKHRRRALEKVPIHATAFLGFAVRGPIGKPVRVTSWRSFEALFGGASPDYLMPHTVFSFFANGGREAMILRVGRQEGEGAATCASLTLKDLYGRPTLKVRAKDPGKWGRGVKVRVAAGSRPPVTKVMAPLERGATEAIVQLTKGFEPGAVVRIGSGVRAEYVTIEAVERKRIRWSKRQALRGRYEEAAVEGVELQVSVTSPFGFEIHDNLVFTPGHQRNLVTVINQTSNTIEVEDLRSRTPSPFNLPQAEVEVALQGGEDGAAVATPGDFIGRDLGLGDRTGLFSLEDYDDVGMVCAPDLDTALETVEGFDEEAFEAVQQAIIDFCERRKTAVALLDMPRGYDLDEARDWRARFDSKYACVFYPWVLAPDPLRGAGATRLVPPCGHVAGLTAQVDSEQGVHRAAANLPLKDVIGLERTLHKDLIDILAPEGINCIRSFRGRGFRPWGARTLSSNASWQHLNVRRLFIMIERSVAEGTEWAVFEPNTWDTWKAVERQVSTFLYKLWREGALIGDVPEQAFYVRCDEGLNTLEVREAGEFHCEIGVAPVRPAEFLVFRIGQQAKDIITEEPYA